MADRLAPITDADARRMIDSIKTAPLLRGVRGETAADIPAIADALLRLSQLVTDFDEIREADLNPVVALERGKGCKVVDAGSSSDHHQAETLSGAGARPRYVVIKTTEPRMTATARRVLGVSASARIADPRMTATTGFT